MARSRNIKPGFFTNDELCALPMVDRLLFAGLWVIADRAGRVEDRPRKIRAEVMPYDDFDADKALEELHAAGFIARYDVAGVKVIQVLAWDKHQNPHVKESPSSLPEQCKNQTGPVLEQGNTQPLPALAGLIPYYLIPDSSPTLKSKTARERAAPAVLVSLQELIDEGVDHQHATDWLTARKAKRLPLTPTAWADTKAEADKAGLTVAQALQRAAKNGWAGFKAAWPEPGATIRPANGSAPTSAVTVPMGHNPADEFHAKMRLADAERSLPPTGLRERFGL